MRLSRNGAYACQILGKDPWEGEGASDLVAVLKNARRGWEQISMEIFLDGWCSRHDLVGCRNVISAVLVRSHYWAEDF